MTDIDACPGPPEDPYPVADNWVWPHQWTPVALMVGQPGDFVADVPNGPARVVEVCPTCRQWRQLAYTRLAPSPDDDG